MHSQLRLILICVVLSLLSCMGGCHSDKDHGPTDQEIYLEAQRIISVGKLLEGSARQPEMAPDLKKQHETYSGFDGRFLVETQCPLLEARIIAFGRYIEGAARQPEMEPALKTLFDSYAGLLTPEDIALHESAIYYRMVALGKLLEAVARQPEMEPLLSEKAAAALGRFAEYPFEAMNTPLALAGRVQLVGKFIEGIARQPEMQPLLEEVLIEFAGDKSMVVGSTECLVNAARLSVLGKLSESTARQPEMFLEPNEHTEGDCCKFKNVLTEQVGPIQPGESSHGCTLPESTLYF